MSAFLYVPHCDQAAAWFEGSSAHLDGGYESTGDVGAEQRGHVQFAHVLFLSQGAGDALLAQELQTGHPVLHAHHVQRRTTR